MTTPRQPREESSSASTLALNVVHDFAAAGSADFKCFSSGAQAHSIKITAIRVANLTNSG